jgi:DNA-binding XRE family transcriptional regulator
MPRRTPDGQPPTHGLSGYRNYGCRCDKCRQANEANPRANAKPRQSWSHGGTVTGYQKYDCRCSACVRAQSEYIANLRATKRRRLDDDPNVVAHGRTTTYVDWGCRCDACSAAIREYGKSKRRRRQRSRRDEAPLSHRARRLEFELAFAAAVGRNRVAADLSQQQLANATGLTADTIAKIEQYKRRVTVGEAGLIADALATTVDAMVTAAPPR